MFACSKPVPRPRGFTLVELMVAMAVGGLLMLLVVTTFSLSRQTGATTNASNVMQEAARVALNAIEADARMVGFRGCNSNGVNQSSTLVNQISGPTGFLADFARGVQGHDVVAGSWSPVPSTSITLALPYPPSTATATDILTLRVATGAPTALAADMANGSAAINVQSTIGFVAGTRAMIADCSRTVVFRVTSVAGTLLAHTAALNSTANLGRAYSTDATVVPFSTVTYFVTRSTVRPNGDERSLWRMVDTGPATELVEHVEDFQVYYGEDTTGNFRAERYVRWPAVANHARVVAIQVALLLRGPRDARAAVAQTFAFNGNAAAVAADTRIRRAFTTTIQLRNRTL